MEVPRLGVKSKLRLLAYSTATATPDLSRIRDLHHRSRQRRILHPLSEAGDGTCNLMVPSRTRFPCATTGTPLFPFNRQSLESLIINMTYLGAMQVF